MNRLALIIVLMASVINAAPIITAPGFTLPSTVPLTNIDNVFYGTNYFIGLTNPAAPNSYGAALIVGTNTTGTPWLMVSNGSISFRELKSSVNENNLNLGGNSLQRLQAGNFNVGVGPTSLQLLTNGSYNVAVGFAALQLATNASSSVAVGNYAQNMLQSGIANTAVGANAQALMVTPSYNTAIGSGVQNVLVVGERNTGVGTSAQNLLTNGLWNTAVGTFAQERLRSGSRNTAVGHSSQQNNAIGNENVSAGDFSMALATNGSGMVTIGFRSGSAETGFTATDATSMKDTNCTFIGSLSGRSSTIANTTPLTNAVALGYNAKAIANNTVTLGGTLKEAVALVINPMSVQPTNIAIGNPYIYSRTNASVAELFAVGGDGVETQISPHADDAPPALYDKATGDMKEIIWRESNPYITNGLVSFINMRRMARTMELQTRVLLLLCGTTNASTTAAAARLKTMTVAEKQVLMTEDYPTYNARTGNNLQPLDWDVIQTGVQATYDMQRANVDLQRTYLGQTNVVIQAQINAGDINLTLVPLPDALPIKNVRQPKPSWMQ